MTSLDETLLGILSEIKNEKVILFLGAGASVSGGGPTTKELLQLLKEAFPKSEKSADNPFELCEDIIDTPGYDLSRLEELVIQRLTKCKVTKYHKSLVSYSWAAIFTTNYDTLVEQAYAEAGQLLHPIFADDFTINPFDHLRTYLFKIMGSISAPEQKGGRLILTSGQYRALSRRRKKYLDILSDVVKYGKLVFVGYSGNDRIMMDIVDRAIEQYGDLVPWSYVLLSHPIVEEKEKFRLERRRMIPVECSFEQFCEWLDKNFSHPSQSVATTGIRLRYDGVNISLDQVRFNPYVSSFEILNEKSVQEEPGNKDEFFRGSNRSWGTFRTGLDFRRSLYEEPKPSQNTGKLGLKRRILAEFSDPEKRGAQNNKLIIVSGMPGVGKTTLLRRLAYDIYESGIPVVSHDFTHSSFDFRTLEGLLTDIEKVWQAQQKPEKPLKFLICVDDAPSLNFSPIELLNFLSSRGKEVVLVVGGRTNEWQMMSVNLLQKIPADQLYSIPEFMDNDERERFTEYVTDLGYMPTGTLSAFIIEREFEGSFFATMYSLVHPTHEPLNKVIKNQYLKLAAIPKRILTFICCLSQFNLPVNSDLLVRAAKCEYGAFQEILEKELKDIVFELEDQAGNLLLTTHHRIIASKTVEFFLSDPKQLEERFMEILADVHFSIEKEKRLVEELLIFYLGPNSKATDLTLEQKRELFKLVCNQEPTRSLLHHWGILETDTGNYEQAERLLKQALSTQEEGFRQEADQNILTSLGNVYAKMARKCQQENRTFDADKYFRLAAQQFSFARYGNRPNGHAFHAQALMYKFRGDDTGDVQQKMLFYSEALAVLQAARQSLSHSDDTFDLVVGMQTEILYALGRFRQLEHIAEDIAARFGNPIAYVAYVTLLTIKGRREVDEKIKKDFLDNAWSIINMVVERFPTDSASLMQKAWVMQALKLDKTDRGAYFDTLKKWRECVEIPTIWGLYNLAVTAFNLSYYKTAFQAFEDLDRISIGHPMRMIPRQPVRINMAPYATRMFTGTVESISSIKEGHIKCHELADLRETIFFAPLGPADQCQESGT